ncbi:MAG TPA: hypothetical protein VLK37_00935 [Solirubrobacterales bacterium]|nr:hypothetical protein [Solirubrobacterales bacterium]
MTNPQPYESVSLTPDLNTVKGFEVNGVKDGVRYSGDCPRCGHPWEKVVPDEVVVMALEAERPESEDEGIHVVQCNCTHPHPDRPDGITVGCGAYWGLRVRNAAKGNENEERVG